jgi:sugar lactone lactonase YvrE
MNHPTQSTKTARSLIGATITALLLCTACSTPEDATTLPPLDKKTKIISKELENPGPMVMDRRGNLYVIHHEKGRKDRGRIVMISPDGSRTILAEKLNHPGAIAINHKGWIFFSERKTGTVRCICPDGTTVSIAEGLEEPTGIPLSRDGDILVACRDEGKIIRISGFRL